MKLPRRQFLHLTASAARRKFLRFATAAITIVFVTLPDHGAWSQAARTISFTGWFVSALEVPEVKVKLILQMQYPVGICGEDFGALLRKEYDEYGRIIREANIKAE